MLGANGLCTSTTARRCWLVPLLWIANKTVQFTCEGKAALAAICCCWCCWVLLAAAGLWQLCPAAGRQAPTARCLLLPADLPRQLTDLSRPLGILVEATIAGIMFLFRVLHHSAQVLFYFEPTLHMLHEIHEDLGSLVVCAVVEVADLFTMIHHPREGTLSVLTLGRCRRRKVQVLSLEVVRFADGVPQIMFSEIEKATLARPSSTTTTLIPSWIQVKIQNLSAKMTSQN